MRLPSEIARKWPAAALTGLALAAAGCGTTSGTQQATGAQSASARAASANAAHTSTGSPAPSSRASASCSVTSTAAPSLYTAADGPGQAPKLAAVQFVSARQGWVAGAGRVLATGDGGRTWTSQYTGTAQLDQVDFTDAAAARPQLHAPDGPGSYPGPFSAISPQEAAFVGYTPPLGYGAAPLEMAASGGAKLTKDGNVSGVSVPEAVAFISSSQGWIVGQTLPSGDFVIVATADGGHTWTRQYQAR